MSMKTEILHVQVRQSAANAKARVMEKLDRATIVQNLVASHVGGSMEPGHETWLSAAEFEIAVTDPQVAARRAAVESEGIGVLVHDHTSTFGGRRERSLHVFLVP